MSFDRPLPPPVFGVSTLQEVFRPEGFCTEQINWRNDPIEMLTRRPQTEWLTVTLPDWSWTPDTIERHTSFKNGNRQEVIVAANAAANQVEVQYRQGHGNFLKDTITLNALWFEAGVPDIGISAMNEGYYIWNRKLTMTTEEAVVPNRQLWKATSLVNVTSALNYSESVTLSVYWDNVPLGTASYSVPGITNADTSAADAARATNAVASGLATQLGNLGLDADAQGSNITASYTDAANSEGTLRIEVSSGRGDSSIAVHNYIATSTTNLPKYSRPDVVRQIAPDPQSNKGRFFLKAVPVLDNGQPIQEVVWSETYDPEGGKLTWSAKSKILKFDGQSLSTLELRDREIGNDASNPPRDFIGKRIEHIEVFQDRLAILAGSKMNLSKTEEHDQFWLGSATELLVTDPTDLGTSGNNSTLRYAVFHNRDLLVFAEDAQFKIDGTTPLTPQTAAMPLTTANECDLDVHPVLMGSSVYYVSNSAVGTGLRRFEVQADTRVDTSVAITDHIQGWAPRKYEEVVANANNDMLVCRGRGTLPNEFLVFEQQTYDDKPVYSWCKWQLREGVVINGLDIYEEVLTIWYNDKYYLRCNLRNIQTFPYSELCLDQITTVTTTQVNGKSTFTIPVGYDFINKPVFTVIKRDDEEALIEIPWTSELVGSTWTITLDMLLPEGRAVVIGYKYESLYQPTRPYLRNEQGVARSTDRLRLAHYFVELSRTYFLKRRIVSEWWDIPDEEFTCVDAIGLGVIGDLEAYTGQWRPQIGMNAADCDVQFITDSPYRATIASISHRSQSYSTRTRR